MDIKEENFSLSSCRSVGEEQEQSPARQQQQQLNELMIESEDGLTNF